MNSLLELNQWVEEIKKLEVNDNNIERLNSFIRTSPEKIADKLNIEREPLVKEFDKHKQEIHNKIIVYNRVKVLKNRKLEKFIFKYNGKSYITKFCICIKFLEIKSNAKFYPSITYLYCELEEIFENKKKTESLFEEEKELTKPQAGKMVITIDF